MKENEEKTLAEKLILKPELANPAVQMLFKKLIDAAGPLPLAHIKARDTNLQMRMQITYEVLTNEIPRIIAEIMNVDIPKDKPKWNFWKWLKKW